MGNHDDQKRTDFFVMFSRVEHDLWRAAYKAHPALLGRGRGAYEGWVLCPRAHATAHLRFIVELTPDAYPGLPGMLWLARQTFAQINRFFDGDDLVFAVGDVQ